MLPSTDHVPSCINQSRSILTQYHQVPTSTAFYWPSSIKYQTVLPCTDTAPTYINQYHSSLTQYHQETTSTAFYWPCTTKYQPFLPSTDPLPSYINQYRSILTQYHQVSTKTNLYCCCLGITDFCTVYPRSCFLFSHVVKLQPFLCFFEILFVFFTNMRCNIYLLSHAAPKHGFKSRKSPQRHLAYCWKLHLTKSFYLIGEIGNFQRFPVSVFVHKHSSEVKAC